MSDNTKTFSFDQIIKGRDSKVRIIDRDWFVLVDLVMVMTGKNRDDAGKVIRNISDEKFSSEKITEKNIGGSGNSRTKLILIKDSIEFIMVLPGNEAKQIRVEFANLIKRYLAGDASLHAEIEANAQSTSPIAQMARASLDSEAVEHSTLLRKREREELECEERRAVVQERRLQNLKTTLEILNMTAINQAAPIDDRTKLQMQDLAKNILFTNAGGMKCITDGAEQASENSTIDFQIVSRDMHLECTLEDAKNLGRLMAERYRSKHQRNPPQHMQFVNGKTIPVNSYMEKDREMMEQVISEYNEGRGLRGAHCLRPSAQQAKPKQGKPVLPPGQSTITFPAGANVVVSGLRIDE